jgi:hypothetical protein
MNKLAACAFALATSLAGVSALQAMPIAPLGAPQDAGIERVAQGCGPGGFRDHRGYCRYAPRRPMMAPPVHRPPPPMVVRPGRACPPGYFLTPRGVCRLR